MHRRTLSTPELRFTHDVSVVDLERLGARHVDLYTEEATSVASAIALAELLLRRLKALKTRLSNDI